MRVAAIDQGTSSTRAMVIDENGLSEICCSLLHQQTHPTLNAVEQNALELLGNVRTCIRAAGNVDALGLANQGESCLAWDSVTREPLSPILTWQDSRTREIIEAMKMAGSEALTLKHAGLPLNPYFSASKLSWLLANLPAVQSAHHRHRLRLGTTDAFLLHHLTGTCATDPSTASRTCLMNLRTGQWDPVLCDLFRVPLACLPEIRSTVGDFGCFEQTRMTASIVDQQASLYGHGCRQPGEAKITFGTGAFLLAHSGDHPPAQTPAGLVPTVAWQIGATTTFALEGGVFHAGSAVAWLKSLGMSCSVDDLSANTPAAIAQQLTFVPALSGLGAPHWDASATATWIGINPTTTPQQLCQAVLEGIALRAVEVLSAVEQSIELQGTLSIDGGMAANRYFAQFLADASGRQILAHPGGEFTALGCAQLAALGAGLLLPDVPRAPVTYSPSGKDRLQWLDTFRQGIESSKRWHAFAG